MPFTSRFPSLRTCVNASCFTVLLGLTGLATAPAAHAAIATTVDPADTFSIELVGYNLNDPSGNFYAIRSGLMPTFGITQTFLNDTLDGQPLTVTSSESVGNGAVTDTITVSIPTNFIPAGTVDSNGNIVNALTFSIGDFYQGGTNPLDFDLPLTTVYSSGSATINPFGTPTVMPIPQQNPHLSNGNQSYANEEGVFIDPAAKTSISFDDVTSFTFTITNVPEPSTTAALLIGAVGVGWAAFRRAACA